MWKLCGKSNALSWRVVVRIRCSIYNEILLKNCMSYHRLNISLIFHVWVWESSCSFALIFNSTALLFLLDIQKIIIFERVVSNNYVWTMFWKGYCWRMDLRIHKINPKMKNFSISLENYCHSEKFKSNPQVVFDTDKATYLSFPNHF